MYFFWPLFHMPTCNKFNLLAANVIYLLYVHDATVIILL